VSGKLEEALIKRAC